MGWFSWFGTAASWVSSAAGAARVWLVDHWKISLSVAGILTVVLGTTCVVHRCADDAHEKAIAEAARLRVEAAKSIAQADAHETQATALGDLVAPLLDAGTAAAARAKDAREIEAARLDAGRDASVGEMLQDLSGVWR